MKTWIAIASTVIIALNMILAWGTPEVWGWLAALSGWVSLTFYVMDEQNGR